MGHKLVGGGGLHQFVEGSVSDPPLVPHSWPRLCLFRRQLTWTPDIRHDGASSDTATAHNGTDGGANSRPPSNAMHGGTRCLLRLWGSTVHSPEETAAGGRLARTRARRPLPLPPWPGHPAGRRQQGGVHLPSLGPWPRRGALEGAVASSAGRKPCPRGSCSKDQTNFAAHQWVTDAVAAIGARLLWRRPRPWLVGACPDTPRGQEERMRERVRRNAPDAR